jgi:hypothetical protein
MRLTRPRIIAVSLAAALFAMSIASMALGGPSVQKLVRGSNAAHTSKKAKKGPRGPQGVPGPQGLQGIQGVPGEPGTDGVPGGASIGVASGPGTPPATADRSLAEVSINLPAPAKVFVTGSSTASVTCNAGGPCTRRIGLYVDSAANPITNSEYDLDAPVSGTVTRDTSLVGVTATLPAGVHALKMFSTDGANLASAADANSNIAAISLTG